MNCSIRAITALTAGLLLLAGPALDAQDKLPLEKSRTAHGAITFIQKETRQFVVKADDGPSYIFSLDERTSIQDQGKDVRLMDMGEGTQVTVTYIPGTSQLYAVSVVGSGKKANGAASVAREKPKEASPIDAEPITVKGKIEKVASDLSEVTVKTFDDKMLTFAVDEDTRTRFKHKVGAVPHLDRGSAVTVVYLIQNGRNRLVTLSNLIQPEPSPGPVVSPGNGQTTNRNTTTYTARMTPNAPNVNVSGGVNPNNGLYGGLPLVGGAVLPGGFVATSNNVAGTLHGTIAQVQRDMLILSAGPATGTPPTPVPMPRNTTGHTANTTNTGNTTNAGSASNAAGNTVPQTGTTTTGGRTELFAAVMINSKEPFILEGNTRILSNNQPIRWQDLREGSMIQAHFNVSGDGSRVVHTILVTDNRVGTNPGTMPTNPNNQPAGRDANGNPIQSNQQGSNQPGRGVPPASQFPPLPGSTGNASNANPAGTQTAATNAANVVSGRIARIKIDSLFLQRSTNDFSFMTTRNSVEPLRMDQSTRFQVNGQDARFTDLRAGMPVQVFVEFVNNARRVIGIVAGNQNTIQPNNTNR